MKRVLFAVMCLSMMLSAGVTPDGVWQVYQASVAPTIDGEMDPVWWTASYERLGHMDAADVAPPDGYLDCFVAARVMWDADNMYIFAKIVDDEISSSSANSWENDSFEMFFDGDNSKAEAMDGVDDIQYRIEYQDGADATLYDSMPEGTVGAVGDWENPAGDAFGWTVEVSIPMAGCQVDPSVGTVFGFELQLNERDNETRENMYRWWGLNNDTWNSPDLWGEAELVGYPAGEVLAIPQTEAAPTVDGAIEDAWTDNSYAIEAGTYVFTNGDVVGSDFTEITEWEDAQMNFRTMWDAAALYVWIEVIDDEISISSPNAWENDSVELYFDGDDSKADLFDGVDDNQYRWVWSSATPGIANDVVAWGELAELEGYTMELAIPAADLKFPLEVEQQIGFELQINDRDNEVREVMNRWWGSDNMSWQNPNRWGTAILAGIGGTDVAREIAPNSFGLNQNFPNPFNPTTTISFMLDKRSAVKLTVFDVLGNEVAQLVNDVRQAGPQTVQFDGSNLSSGVYFYKLETASNIVTKKMMLMK